MIQLETLEIDSKDENNSDLFIVELVEQDEETNDSLEKITLLSYLFS